VLDKLPQRLQPRAKRALHEILYAECRADYKAARARFATEYQPKYSKTVESLTANWERLVTFFEFPAEASADYQCDRVAIRYRTLARARDQGPPVQEPKDC